MGEKLESVNNTFLDKKCKNNESVTVNIVKVEEAELDEMWSFVKKKSRQRWLWHAIDHQTHTVLAYHFGPRKDSAFKALQKKLSCFDIEFYYSDDWGSYERHLPKSKHFVGKRNTQAIERKHLTLRTRIKRLARKTICFSKLDKLHDIVIGLFINRFEFGRKI